MLHDVLYLYRGPSLSILFLYTSVFLFFFLFFFSFFFFFYIFYINFEFFISPSIPSRKKTSYSRYHYLKTFISHRVNSSFVPFNTSFISTDPFSLVALKCMCGCCVAHNKKTENTKKMCCFLRALVLHLQHYLDPFSSTKR